MVVFDEFFKLYPCGNKYYKKITADADEVYITLCTNTLICDEMTKTSLFAPTVITADKLIRACSDGKTAAGKKIYLNEQKAQEHKKMLSVFKHCALRKQIQLR
ncbi:MAG: hypothetical protein L6V93_07545 [Clostridiales bacterium]|nr:MAG: hypothetical protein L6V93_07545 [Clostridiales bacterium]